MAPHSPWFTALALVLVPNLLPGQACAVRNHYRIANSVNNVPGSELRNDSGWQTTAPLTTPGANYNSNPQGCFSQGNCHPVSDYGYLHVDGTGSAATCSAGGVFLWLDEWIGGEPKAQFRDVLQVTSATLPPGTPVQVAWTMTFTGFASGTDPGSLVSKRLQLSCGPTLIDTQANGTFTAVTDTTVGASLQVTGRLWATIRVNALLGGPPATGSYALDLTGTFAVTGITAGANAVFCSGAAYEPLAARSQPVGIGCGVVPPSLAATAPVLGGASTLSMTGAPPGQSVVLAIAGGAPLWVTLGGCTLHVDLDAMILLDVVGASDGAGHWGFVLPIPLVPVWAGTSVTVQTLPLLANGPFLGFGELSNGVELRLGY